MWPMWEELTKSRGITKRIVLCTKTTSNFSMSTSLTINLKRASKVYHEGETIAGVVVVSGAGEVRHEGLTLLAEGSVSLQLSSKSVGLLEAFSNNIKDLGVGVTNILPRLPTFLQCDATSRFTGALKNKSTADAPLNLLSTSMELAAAGRIPAGVTEIPFELPLRSRHALAPGSTGPGLLETYHGVFVNVMYSLKCTMRRSFLNKPLNAGCQFFVQYRQQDPAPLKPVRCEITPATIRAAGGGGGGGGGAGRGNMPLFQIYAEIHSTVCALDKPITGKIRVDECSVPIKSIELQLVRVETCGCAEGYSKDATEIQNIQLGSGDVCRGRDVPLYMVLPRLFTCPTTTTTNFKIEFELNIAVIFEDDYLVTENFPILLLRSR